MIMERVDLTHLNSQQLKAVVHKENPCLVLAGAGSGKTRVLIHRIAKLIEDGVEPEEILACTFSKKAAEEMKSRLAELIGSETAERVTLSTFHSVCFLIVQKNASKIRQGAKWFKVLDEYKATKLAKDILQAKRMNKKAGLNWKIPHSMVLSAIGLGKNRLFNFDTPENYFRSEGLHKNYNKFYEMYESDKEETGSIDFDDMLYMCWKLFRQYPNVLQAFQNKWKWILIDETQDTNLAQYEIASMIAKPENNIFVVGDDFQSIYGFRGACPEVSILGFMDRYPNGKVIKLEQNYRSTPEIINIANKLKVENPYDKRLIATRGTGYEPCFRDFLNATKEGDYVAQEIKKIIAEGYKHNDIAVLYRTNAQSEAIESALIKEKIPYKIFGGISFYKRREIKDMISYLQVLHDPHSEEGSKAFFRIWNIASENYGSSTHFFGAAFKSEIENKAKQEGISDYDAIMKWFKNKYSKGFLTFRDKGRKRAIKDMENILNSARAQKTIADKINAIREVCYNNYLLDEDESSEDNVQMENLDRLVEVSRDFVSEDDFIFFVKNMIDNSTKAKEDEVKDFVSLMTVHKSKGLEYPIIFGIGLSQGILPHSRANDIGEERRICYVLLTRAKDRLYLSNIKEKDGKELSSSIFLNEIEMIIENAEEENN